jgi:hypothetical protein
LQAKYFIKTKLNKLKNIMTKQEIIEAIKVLTEVVKANNGLLGSESIKIEANEKIQELMKLL